jgi:hypothetical protein
LFEEWVKNDMISFNISKYFINIFLNVDLPGSLFPSYN